MAMKKGVLMQSETIAEDKELASLPDTQDQTTGNTIHPSQPDGNAAGFCVYLGPTIIGVIQHGTVYVGDKAQALRSIARAVEQYPLIATLVVDGKTLPEDRIKVKTAGNLLHVHYMKLSSSQTK